MTLRAQCGDNFVRVNWSALHMVTFVIAMGYILVDITTAGLDNIDDSAAGDHVPTNNLSVTTMGLTSLVDLCVVRCGLHFAHEFSSVHFGWCIFRLRCSIRLEAEASRAEGRSGLRAEDRVIIILDMNTWPRSFAPNDAFSSYVEPHPSHLA